MSEPLVAVVVPVYDGADSLRDCLESVLAQRYSNWMLFVSDNASRDGSAQIADAFAARDPRVRVVRHREHVGMLANWNRALACAPDDAVYVKQLNVDDRLRPDCLRRLVAAAEANPRAGVVSSHFMSATRGRRPVFEYDAVTLVPGRQAIREVLVVGPCHLVHPSVLLLRRAAASRWPDFYDPSGFPPTHPDSPFLAQCDKVAFFDVLERFDLAFVPEILTDIAPAVGGTASGFMARVGAWQAGRLETILRHGSLAMDAQDRRAALRSSALRYLRTLVWRVARGRSLGDASFRLYQRHALAHILPRLARERLGIVMPGLHAMAWHFGARSVAADEDAPT